MALHVSTTASSPWSCQKTFTPSLATKTDAVLTLGSPQKQSHPWRGFGGCFNEMGWDALLSLNTEQRAGVLEALFGQTGCKLTWGRLPIGASDYALEWYSHNEHPDDFGMAHFSISRDEHYLIPYIKAALAVQPDLQFFASPWSPPTWMKYPRAHNYGTLIRNPENLKAYALYFVKFIEAYARHGITIAEIHPQNEPKGDQKFPSCLWTGPEMADFIRDYLAPAFAQHDVEARIFFGTLNTSEYDTFFLPAILAARDMIDGVGLQWEGKNMIHRIHSAFPDLAITQTENECGDGKQTWDYAGYVFNLFQHYITQGASSYIYWNNVLPTGGRSTWGWNQNAMVTIEKSTGQVTYTHEFYLMKHFAHFIAPGAQMLQLSGELAANAVAFCNTERATTVVIHNPLIRPLALQINAGTSHTVTLPAQSFNTIHFEENLTYPSLAAAPEGSDTK